MSETRESSATSYARLQRFLVGERRISKQPGVRLRRDPPVPLRDTVAGRDVVPDEEFLEPALPAGAAVQERASREFGGETWVLVDGPGVSGWVRDGNLLPVGGPDAAGPGADARRERAARDPVSIPRGYSPVRKSVASASGRCHGPDAAPAQAGRKAAADDLGTKAKRARGGGDFQALPVCTNVFHCGFGDCGSGVNCLEYPGLKPTGADGKLAGGGMTKHYNSKHGRIKYAMGAGNEDTRMLYGRLVNEKGVRQFGTHAPGCTEDNRLCASSGMVQCPDSDMHPLSVKMRRLVSETYRPSEFEHTDMPSGDLCDASGADDGDERRAKKKRAETSKHNAMLAAQRAMQCKGGE
eukprot:COSAG06_NODE_6834_length_2752_cov_12.062571_2_plen_353_part_00